MKVKDKAIYEERAAVMKALAHPSRLMMVDELSRGERCVCELTDLVGADISTVSKHLSILKKAGIVDCRKDGVQRIYRLKVPCVVNIFSCIEAVHEERHRESTAESGLAKDGVRK
ncbi:MAG: ArsR/SmtB family transcription factor [Planctomycetota bacterium]